MAQMPIPDDWDGETTCRWAVCWPDSPRWFAILNGLLGNPFQGRFWDANTGSVVGVKESFRAIYNKNFSLEGVIMACGDTGLSELAAAVRLLAQNQCCEGVPGSGGVTITITSPEGTITPIYGDAPPGGLPPGDLPPGYPGTLEEYNADKCRTAASLITGWIASMRNLAYVNFLENTALIAVVIAAVAGIIVMPPFLIPILIAAAIGQVGLQSGLLSLADGIEANFDAWVCYLYQSDSTEEILGLLSDALDAVLAAIPATGALGWALKTIALIMMNSSTINKLFELNQGSGAPYDCDCGEVEGALNIWSDIEGCGGQGTITNTEGNVYTVEAKSCTGQYMIDFFISTVPGSLPDQIDTNVDIAILSGSVNSGSPSSYRFWDAVGTELWNSSSPPDYPICCSNGSIRSNTAFEIEVTLTPCE